MMQPPSPFDLNACAHPAMLDAGFQPHFPENNSHSR